VIAGRERSQRGQTTVEYLMIAGLITAIIISLTKIIVPTMAWVVVKLVRHMAVYVSSVG
jgi:Flp pilus assembly pilin Flp